MTSSPKRPWFRFHLLTAVLMMLAAGGMMWLNLCKRLVDLPADGAYETEPLIYGWPLNFAYHGPRSFRTGLGMTWGDGVTTLFFWRGVIVDVVVFILILVCVTSCIEFLLRRREGRKP